MDHIYNYQNGVKPKSIWESAKVSPKSTETFAEINGPGVINKLWLTTFPISEKEDIELAHNLILKIYWEDSKTAAVSAPLADFFCQPLKLQEFENHFFHSTNNQLLFVCTIPMPFRKVAKLELENNSDKEVELFYGIDLELKQVEQNAMYLHTHWQSSINLPPENSFLILPKLNGRGRFLGMHLSLYQNKVLKNWPWYTRPISIHLDSNPDDQDPAVYVKTIDDYFGSAWWDREPVHNTYTFQHIGRPLVEEDENGNLAIALYRYHVQQPLWFKQNIKIEIGPNWNWGNQIIGNGNWTTISFLYLADPSTVIK